jgi:hypothetical protein
MLAARDDRAVALHRQWRREEGLDEVIDEPDRSVGVDMLLDYELIVPTRRSYRPSDQVLYSLRLRPWRSPGW